MESSLEENKKGRKEGSFLPIILVTFLSFAIFTYWDKIPFMKNAVHNVLDPSAGALLGWNLTIGMLVIIFIITLITTLIQKYTTDQKALKELRNEQKILQEEMKKFEHHPEKLAELSKKQFEFFPRTLKLTSRGVLFTGVPFILFYRWFYDIFSAMIDPATGKSPLFFGFFSWFWFYMISMIIFSTILRKYLKVV
jgi:uncharacterized membrane protein (DUF106 family)